MLNFVLLFLIFLVFYLIWKQAQKDKKRKNAQIESRRRWIAEIESTKKAWWAVGCTGLSDEDGSGVCAHCGALGEHHDKRYEIFLMRDEVIKKIKKLIPNRSEQEVWEELGRPDSWSPELAEKISTLKVL